MILFFSMYSKIIAFIMLDTEYPVLLAFHFKYFFTTGEALKHIWYFISCNIHILLTPGNFLIIIMYNNYSLNYDFQNNDSGYAM